MDSKLYTKEENDFLEEMRRTFPNVGEVTLEMFLFKLQDIRITATKNGFDSGFKKGHIEASLTWYNIKNN